MPMSNAVIVLLFTLPKIYELRKPELDSAASQVVSKTKQSYSQYAAPYINKIPKASTATSSGLNKPGNYSSTADSASGYSGPRNYSSTAESASVAPPGPLASGVQEFKKTY